MPSTGEYCPFVHLFFEFADHSHIAFFDLGDNGVSVPDPATPRWVNHFAMEVENEAALETIAMEVENEAALETMRRRLTGHGIETVGPTDHHFIRSIYFFDPNGLRLEITVRLPMHDYVADKRRAHDELAAWTRDKAAGLRARAAPAARRARPADPLFRSSQGNPMSKPFASQADLAEKKISFETPCRTTTLDATATPATRRRRSEFGRHHRRRQRDGGRRHGHAGMAQDLIRAIRGVTDKLSAHVALTHYHAVRVLGASAFAAEGAATVIASRTHELIVERATPTGL